MIGFFMCLSDSSTFLQTINKQKLKSPENGILTSSLGDMSGRQWRRNIPWLCVDYDLHLRASPKHPYLYVMNPFLITKMSHPFWKAFSSVLHLSSALWHTFPRELCPPDGNSLSLKQAPWGHGHPLVDLWVTNTLANEFSFLSLQFPHV